MYLRVERQAGISQAVSEFLTRDILGVDTFYEGQELDPAQFLENAVKKLEGKFEDEPLVEANLRSTLGSRCLRIGNPELARQQLERAYHIRLHHLGPEHKSTIGTAKMLHSSYRDLGLHEDALELVRRQLEIARRVYGETYNRVPLFMNNIAGIYIALGMYKEAEAQFDEVLEHCERFPSRYRDHAIRSAKVGRGQSYLGQGHYEKAERAMLEVLPVFREQLGPEHEWTLRYTRALSEVYHAQGRYEEAQQLCEAAYDTMRQELGSDDPDTLRTMCSLGRILTDRGQFDQASELLRGALTDQRRKLGDEREDTLRSKHGLAVLLTKQEKYDEAERLFVEILERRKRKLKAGHPSTWWTLNDLGVLRREQERYEEAESMLRQALEGRQRKLGEDHPACFESMHELAVLHMRQARYEDAEPLLLEAHSGCETKLGPEHAHTLDSLKQLVILYESWNKPDEAEKWRAKLPPREAAEE
jgi:tetratricopeptide (TPR) repeat protein